VDAIFVQEAAEKFKELNKIHSVLSDPMKREDYDRYGETDDNDDMVRFPTRSSCLSLLQMEPRIRIFNSQEYHVIENFSFRRASKPRKRPRPISVLISGQWMNWSLS
jgi:DnaJ-class molecular chaperone